MLLIMIFLSKIKIDDLVRTYYNRAMFTFVNYKNIFDNAFNIALIDFQSEGRSWSQVEIITDDL